MRNWLPQQWHRLTGWHALLWPLSLLFRLAVRLRRALYRCGLCKPQRLPVPVLVVGNISVGGSGKTPLVAWMVEFLRSRGYQPGVISRGYGGCASAPQPVVPGSAAVQVGDEPVLLARRLHGPVWVGADKVAVARALLEAHPDCDLIISDDGLQHYRLARDLEWAVVDGQRRFGNRLLLPAGPLREPLVRLNSVDAVVVNGGKAGQGEFNMDLIPGLFCNLANPAQQVSAAAFSRRKLHAVAGIGNPERFFQSLRAMGLSFSAHAFPDHYVYAPCDLQFEPDATILMTEKDAVKCLGFAPQQSWYLPVRAVVDAALGEQLMTRLKEWQHGRKTA